MFSDLSTSSGVGVPWNKQKYFGGSLRFLGMKKYLRVSSMSKKMVKTRFIILRVINVYFQNLNIFMNDF